MMDKIISFDSSLTFLKKHEYMFIHLYKNIDLIVCLISAFRLDRL